jgi:hypothetical protein
MQGGLYLDPTRKPKTYDLATSTKTIEGIYSLDGDTLRLCYDLGTEAKRPVGFTTEKSSQQVIIVLRRTHGPEVFPHRLLDGTRAFPPVIERATSTPPQVAPQTPDSKLNGYRAKEQPKEEQRTPDVSTYQEVRATKAADQREYTVTSRLVEASAEEPKTVLSPRLTLLDGQPGKVIIDDGPKNLLEKVILDENIKIGTSFDVRVQRLQGNKVRLFLSFAKNEVEKADASEIRVLGSSVRAIQDVELHKAVKVVFQKDAKGSAQRWVEITVDEFTITDEQPIPPPARKESRPRPAATKN